MLPAPLVAPGIEGLSPPLGSPRFAGAGGDVDMVRDSDDGRNDDGDNDDS